MYQVITKYWKYLRFSRPNSIEVVPTLESKRIIVRKNFNFAFLPTFSWGIFRRNCKSPNMSMETTREAYLFQSKGNTVKERHLNCQPSQKRNLHCSNFVSAIAEYIGGPTSEQLFSNSVWRMPHRISKTVQ